MLLRLRRATFGYGAHAVVADVDLEVLEGEWIGVLGPNGAGKTTLLQGMMGLLPPMDGAVELAPVPIGYVPQRETLSSLYPLTVEEVVRMGAFGRLSRLRRLPPGERERVRSGLERVGLADYARERFASLSGGQRQRALIARALVMLPRILFLDEPTHGIDRRSLDDVMRVFEELRADAGISVVLVSHDLSLVRGLVDELLRVEEGRAERTSPEPVGQDRHGGGGAPAP